MRGLTGHERACLTSMAAPGPSKLVESEAQEEVLESLVAQGRVRTWTESRTADGYTVAWRITEAGRQALAVDEALRALGVARG